jgi:hypothetical protein
MSGSRRLSPAGGYATGIKPTVIVGPPRLTVNRISSRPYVTRNPVGRWTAGSAQFLGRPVEVVGVVIRRGGAAGEDQVILLAMLGSQDALDAVGERGVPEELALGGIENVGGCHWELV